jgi:hypothetical protein
MFNNSSRKNEELHIYYFVPKTSLPLSHLERVAAYVVEHLVDVCRFERRTRLNVDGSVVLAVVAFLAYASHRRQRDKLVDKLNAGQQTTVRLRAHLRRRWERYASTEAKAMARIGSIALTVSHY